jgi:predicted HicB family RNase H-like nuclease
MQVVPLSVRLPLDVHRKLKDRVARNELSLNETLWRALELGLAEAEKRDRQ